MSIYRGTTPKPEYFPKRNRIISGLSDGILLVEAWARSGSFITVDFALEQGKEIFAIPGDIDRQSSIRTNKLISQGAKLVITPKDIIECI